MASSSSIPPPAPAKLPRHNQPGATNPINDLFFENGSAAGSLSSPVVAAASSVGASIPSTSGVAALATRYAGQGAVV